MKPSIYNYKIKDAETTIFFNGLSEYSFRVNNRYAESFENIINNPSVFNKSFESFINTMIQKGFIIKRETDESILLRNKLKNLYRANEYTIMILPTYQCNLRCWYCVQDHSNTYIDDFCVNKIKLRISKMLNKDNVKKLNISWFGGEPLLSYNQVLHITKWAKALSDSLNKTFSATITTNGTLLDKNKILELKCAGVENYQITIDGDRLSHNQIKTLRNSSAFDISMKNVGYIMEHTHCLLRFNYTKKNMSPDSIINDLDKILPQNGRHNITFLIYKVWQEESNCVPQSQIEDLMQLASKIGLQPKLAEPGICYADQAMFECVFSNGRIGKCDNQSPTAANGFINDNGDVEWNLESESVISFLEKATSECHDCKYLPLCWGPCIAKRNKAHNDNRHVVCQYTDKDSEMANLIRNIHINHEYANPNI